MRLCGAAAALATVLASPGVRGLECPAPPDAPALQALDAEVRLQLIQAALDEETRKLETWSYAWGSTYAAATAAQLGALPFVDPRTRVDLSVGAASAAIGTASLFLLPLRITRQSSRMRASLQEQDRCRLLAESERRFEDAARVDALSGSWVAHAGNLAFNAALVLVLGVGYGHWKSAAISAGVGTAVGEANLLTQPHLLPAAWERYRAGQRWPMAGATWSIRPWGGPDNVGISLSVVLRP